MSQPAEEDALKTNQDNACTAHPIYLVQSRRRLYGLDPIYGGPAVWLDSDGEEVNPAEIDEDNPPEGVYETGYQDIWEFVQCFFTAKGANEYIKANSHRMTDPRIYVDSGYRNYEWQAIRNLLIKRATE